MFIVEEKAIEMIVCIRSVVETIEKRDRDLGRHSPGGEVPRSTWMCESGQIRRAASSVPLNIGEGNKSFAGNRRERFRNAHGSAAEVREALKVASAWGYIENNKIKQVDKLLNEIGAILHTLINK